jgi:hypothetical protein
LVLVTSAAVLLAPLTVGALADATSLTAALGMVPVALGLAAAGLTTATRVHATGSSRPVLDARAQRRPASSS